jgi:hypothetical protein
MAIFRGPKVVTNGLVLALDAADSNSYRGTGTTWTDLTGNGYNGTLVNTPTFSTANLGNFTFNGTTQYVDVVNTGTAFQFANTSFTVSIWIRTSSTTTGIIVSKGATASTGGWLVEFDTAGTITTTTKGSTGFNTFNRTSSVTVNNNTWTNIVVIYTTNTTTLASNTASIYVNGSLRNGTGTLGTIVYATTTDTVQIGRRPSGIYFNGNISNVQIYNRGITATEVLQNYNATKSRFGL